MIERETLIQLLPNYALELEKEIDTPLSAKRNIDISTVLSKSKLTVKRLTDILVSVVGIIIIAPFVPFIAWQIKRDAKGPFIYRQERIGRNGQPFEILKFRSMYMDAEQDGPALSSSTDKRVTPFGRFLRKWRIDEFPQFFNVLKGDMSIIGPRPERQFYINKLLKEEPSVLELLKVKPGITSLGQVLFGYAENTTEMLQRVKIELFYIRKFSLRLDFRIFLFTIRTLFKAEGK